MSKDNFEKDFEDDVYEDGYYEEHCEQEELNDDTEAREEDKEAGEETVEDDENKIHVSFACEDCDYRWDDVIIRNKERLDEIEEFDHVCPMCGSMNITQI